MKKYLILSALASIPIMIFGIVNPLVVFMHDKTFVVNQNAFWIYIILLAVSISMVVVTNLMMVRYSSKIDDLDKAIEDYYKKKEELNTVIRQYNTLIRDHVKDPI